MTHSPDASRSLPASCDLCGGEMRFSYAQPHPDRPGDLHVFACTACRIPMVRFVDRDERA